MACCCTCRALPWEQQQKRTQKHHHQQQERISLQLQEGHVKHMRASQQQLRPGRIAQKLQLHCMKHPAPSNSFLTRCFRPSSESSGGSRRSRSSSSRSSSIGSANSRIDRRRNSQAGLLSLCCRRYVSGDQLLAAAEGLRGQLLLWAAQQHQQGRHIPLNHDAAHNGCWKLLVRRKAPPPPPQLTAATAASGTALARVPVLL